MIIRADCFKYIPYNIEANSIPLIITDPPYGSIVKDKWDKEWTLNDQCHLSDLIERTLVNGGTAYVWGGIGAYRNRIFFKWLAHLEDRDTELRIWDVITWSKKRAYGSNRRYLFTREECVMLVKGDEPNTFNIPLLSEKRGYAGYNKDYPAKSEYKRRTNVWTDITEIFSGKIHPTEKPSRLAEIMIETSSNSGDTVLDMFAGSGSTGIAAEKLGRKSILIEKRSAKDCPMRLEE